MIGESADTDPRTKNYTAEGVEGYSEIYVMKNNRLCDARRYVSLLRRALCSISFAWNLQSVHLGDKAARNIVT